MSKNYANIYNSGNDSISLEQRFYLKQETVRGVIEAPVGSDFFFHLPGGQISYEQPFESSMQRSGRHHNNIIKKKITSAWNLSTYFNIDEDAILGVTEIDPSLRVLWKSLLGNEATAPGLSYEPSEAPDLTFSLFEVGDTWSRQAAGAFVQGGNVQLPGDGEATVEWTGNAKISYFVGIAQSIAANDGGNTLQLEAGEARRIPKGALVMIVEADGLTRSDDTPDGSPRTVTASNVTTDVITVDGAVLADADGSGVSLPIYVSYYEPETPVAIDNPVTGLEGSVSVVGLSSQCFRSLGINVQNNHELVDYCYGEEGLGGAVYIPGDRLTAELTLSMNLNHTVGEFLNRRTTFESEDITAVLGDSAGRHFKALVPRAIFSVPAFAVPDTGSIPVEFSGTAYQTANEAADELTVKFL